MEESRSKKEEDQAGKVVRLTPVDFLSRYGIPIPDPDEDWEEVVKEELRQRLVRGDKSRRR